MYFRLGYVASPVTLEYTTYSKTLTYTNYQKLDLKSSNEKLDKIIKENFEALKKTLEYNALNDIYFYRLSHNIIPLATHRDVPYEFIEKYKYEWKEVGDIIKKYNFRVDCHPDQYCVLNSKNNNIINNSIEILLVTNQMFEAMGIKSQMILHIGGGKEDKESGLKRFAQTFEKLPKDLQNKIILENDDRIYTIEDTLKLCEKLEIPMVLDYHHYNCNHTNKKLKNLLPRIFKTWEHSSFPPKIHFSSPKNAKEKRTHADYANLKEFIKMIELLKPLQQDVDIMLELKAKDDALLKLSRQLRFYTNYEFINNSTFRII